MPNQQSIFGYRNWKNRRRNERYGSNRSNSTWGYYRRNNACVVGDEALTSPVARLALSIRGADETTVRYPSAASTPYDRANGSCSLVRRWAIRGATIPAREILYVLHLSDARCISTGPS